MALLRRLQPIRVLNQTFKIGESSYLLGCSKSYSNNFSNGLELNARGFSSLLHNSLNDPPWTHASGLTLRSMVAIELSVTLNDKRFVTTQAKAPAQARQMGALKVSISSPGFIYEPYAPREPISFWQRWFTKSGWRRTKEDIMLEVKSAYAIAKLRKFGYKKDKFYTEAIGLYKEINALIAKGEKTMIRKAVTEKMYSALKNEIKQHQSRWSYVYWEIIEPVVSIRTLRARLIGVDKSNLDKVFIQMTLEFLTKQKFEAYDSSGSVVAGDKTKEVLVRDIWVFEKSLFQAKSYWRLCGRIPVKPASA